MSKRKFKSNKRTNISLVVALLLCISVGFALIGTNLNIIGTTNIASTKWDVHWANLSVTEGSVTGTQVTTPATIKTGNTEVEFSITLNKPGEYYEFTVDAVNQGTLDAMINSITNKIYESNGTTEKTLPAYLNYIVTYNDGVALAQYHKLAASTTETIKVRVEFKTDIDASQLPESGDTIVFKYSTNYVQADNNAINVHHPFTGTKYSINGGFNIGSEIPAWIPTYDNYTDAITAFGHDYFVRHLISNDVITESYVGFVKDSNVYYLRGAGATLGDIDDDDVEDLITPTPYYESNKTVLLNAFGSENCQLDRSNIYSDCSMNGLKASASVYGEVQVGVGSFHCGVERDGISSCGESIL